ncbi:unnamed protein product [Rotaria socialis]
MLFDVQSIHNRQCYIGRCVVSSYSVCVISHSKKEINRLAFGLNAFRYDRNECHVSSFFVIRRKNRSRSRLQQKSYNCNLMLKCVKKKIYRQSSEMSVR